MTQFKPFANDTQSTTVMSELGQGITIENGFDEITLYGDITINKDSVTQSNIDELIKVLEDIKKELPVSIDKN